MPNARLCVVVEWCGFYVKIHVISSDRDSSRENGELRAVTVKHRVDSADSNSEAAHALVLSMYIGRENGTYCWH